MYHYVDSGLDNIYLANGYTVRKTQEGEFVAIHDLDGLHRLIASNIVQSNRNISGPEFRFIRIELDLTQKLLADLMDVSESTLRNWESGRTAVTGPAAAVIRQLYMESINDCSPLGELLENISKLNRDIHQATIKLEETEDGWKLAA